jgi:uncharacterized protein (TIGR02996 family)
MSSPTPQAFLDAVLASPDDDGPRLVYADWLDERGDPRGEFICIQVELEHLPRWHPRKYLLSWREQELLDRHRREWTAGLPELEGIAWGAFRRGFVHAVRAADLATLVKHADAIARAAPVAAATVPGLTPDPDDRTYLFPVVPWLRELTVLRENAPASETAGALARCPLLSTLRRLDLSYQDIDNAALKVLAECPHLAGLTQLILREHLLGPGGLAPLAGAAFLPGLTVLDLTGVGPEDHYLEAGDLRLLAGLPLGRLTWLGLSGNALGAAGVGPLLVSHHLSGLERLDLRATDLGEDDIEELADLSASFRLRVLHIGENRLKDHVAALGRAGWLTDLRELKAPSSGVGDVGARRLLASVVGTGLRILDLAENRIDLDGLRALAAAELPHLHALNLAGNVIGPKGGRVVAGAPWAGRLLTLDLSRSGLHLHAMQGLAASCANLRELLLAGNDVPAEGAACLAEAPALAGLVVLSLADNPVGNAGLAALAGPGRLPRLNTLDVAGCGLGPGALTPMADAAALPALARLHLDRNQLTGRDVEGLVQYPVAGRLVELVLPMNEVGDAGARALAGSPRLHRLERLDLARNQLTRLGLEALAAAPHWGQDFRLSWWGNVPGHDLAARFRERFPFI